MQTKPTTLLALLILFSLSLSALNFSRAATIAHWDFTIAKLGAYTNIAPDTAAAGASVSALVWVNEAARAERPIGVVLAPHAGTRLTAGMAQGVFDGRAYEIPTTATSLSPITQGGPLPRGASSLEFTVKAAAGKTLALTGFSFSLGYATSRTDIKNYLSPCASLFVSTDDGKTFRKIGATEFLRTGDSRFFDKKTGYALRENITFTAATFKNAGLGKSVPLAAGATVTFRLAIGEDANTNVATRRYLVDDLLLTGDIIPSDGSSAGAQIPLPPASFAVSVDVTALNPIGEINPDIYGQYIEHVQMEDECIYPSIWDDTSPLSDAMGLRRDVIASARELGVPVIRWPGGCFADVYHWEDAIGPRASRTPVRNTHWKTDEPNTFGTDEFLGWSNQIGAKAYINVNLGSGTLSEALRWLEYCNASADTPQGKRRAANGHPGPYNVPYWGIGNETWASWETGFIKDPKIYAAKLAEWAAAMRKKDPRIKILAVGSSSGRDAEWDTEVVKTAGHLIDYLTLHHYGRSTNYTGEEYETVVYNQPADFDYCLRRMLHHIDIAASKAGLKNDIKISMDEWNIRHLEGKRLLRKDPRNLQDALFAASVLNAMIRLSPRIGMANYVFLVNGHAPLLVNENSVVKTPLFYIFQQYGRWMQGTALDIKIVGPEIAISPARMPNPAVPRPAAVSILDAAAALNPDSSIVLALVNRHETDDADLTLSLPENYVPGESWTLTADDIYAQNTFAFPQKILPGTRQLAADAGTYQCPARSITLLRCMKK